LAGGLTGSNFAAEASSFLDAEGPPPGTGQLIVAFDPVALGGPDAVMRFATLASALETQPGARLPGARRIEARQKARRDGLAVGDGLLVEIERI
jgi:(2R)-3-sulfolactate dehydrogenase (NADP+)